MGSRAEDFIRPMKVVEEAKDSVTLGKFQMVEIVGLRRTESRNVIAAMVVQSGNDGHTVPQPRDGNV